ncbi:hypothetical protein PVK06_024343 [Gossypium arboreum]|uniref:Transposase MuDR plant domain-containing protein n=1 Tax=Gossypium arboreum TaxID=29729 RepID=A0ABR0PDT4_GOSAR|nr:hypothetical protein PVK06_024343 [Gossypium arboreum]
MEVGMEYPNKDVFLTALKWYSIKNGVNYCITNPRSKKFKGTCATKDRRCKWKIMFSYQKKTRMWMIKKYPNPHTYVVMGASPRIEISMLIANIRSQYQYTSMYYKVWVAKQKAMEKLHHGWEGSYNYLQQWCSVLNRYILGTITDLEMHPGYYGDQLIPGKRVFH